LKIVFISPFASEENMDYSSESQVGAIEQQIFGLSKELSKKGHDVYVLRKWESPKEIEFIKGVKFVNLTIPLSYKKFSFVPLSSLRSPITLIEYWLYSRAVRNKIEEISPDIVNVSNILPGYLLSKIPFPIVFITHDNDVLFADAKITACFRKYLARVLVGRVAAVVALNKGLQEHLGNQGFRTDVIIPNGLDPDEYRNAGNNGFVMYSGWLDRHKKIEDLVKAYSKIQKVPQNLVIVGNGSRKAILTSLVCREGISKKVAFIPFLPKEKYREYLSKCSFFVLPSDAEAFGVVIIEAMASGKPVIARNIIGPNGIIKSGYNGFLFKDVDDLAKRMQLLLSDDHLRSELGKNARETIEKEYSFSNISLKYIELYKKICGAYQ
jgi:glycosyltransferase involved in cell wall biosynthesis